MNANVTPYQLHVKIGNFSANKFAVSNLYGDINMSVLSYKRVSAVPKWSQN